MSAKSVKRTPVHLTTPRRLAAPHCNRNTCETRVSFSRSEKWSVPVSFASPRVSTLIFSFSVVVLACGWLSVGGRPHERMGDRPGLARLMLGCRAIGIERKRRWKALTQRAFDELVRPRFLQRSLRRCTLGQDVWGDERPE